MECVAGSGTEPQVTHGRPCGPIMLSTDTQSVARDRGKQWRGDRPPGKARLAVLRRQAFSGGDGTVGMATRAWELSPCPCDTGPGVPTWLHVGVTWGAVKWTGVQAPSGSAPPASLGMEPGARNGPRPRGVLACTPDWGTLLGGRSLPSCPRSPGWSTGCSRECHHWALTPAAQGLGSQSLDRGPRPEPGLTWQVAIVLHVHNNPMQLAFVYARGGTPLKVQGCIGHV